MVAYHILGIMEVVTFLQSMTFPITCLIQLKTLLSPGI